ncbi:MAG TPA: exodeoxyribonuclease VII small subunit [Rectinemataceae bacterium]|nr:exodeoxyribonuclease VII small subunit [Rectinemataceae bacterium]
MKDFESRLQRLEVLAEAIKDQNLPLEEAIKVFEEGIKLSKGLKKELEKIQGKVEMLISKPDEVEKPEISLFKQERDE